MVTKILYFASSLPIELLYEENNYWGGEGFMIMLRMFALHDKTTTHNIKRTINL
jgi:hypothetical protein